MSIIERHKQAIQDLDYIEGKYGSIDCKDDKTKDSLENLLRNPNRQVAFEIVYDQLVELFQRGYVARTMTLGGIVMKPLPLTDEKIAKIQERWDLPEPPKESDLESFL